MTTTAAFTVSHNTWSALPAQQLAAGARVRRARGGASESWRIELDHGRGCASPGVGYECSVCVTTGRLLCLVLGNEIELQADSFLLIPPNVPFVLRSPGRAGAVALVHFAGLLGAAPPLEGG